MIVSKKSQLTGIVHERNIPITEEGYYGWVASGVHIQHYFPGLSADDREFLLTGITPEEWDEAFPPEEDEGDDSLDYPYPF